MAQVRFSLHAKRRMMLYGIANDTVVGILPVADTLRRHAITRQIPGHKYPVKVVYEVKNESTVVITAYPLRKAKQ